MRDDLIHSPSLNYSDFYLIHFRVSVMNILMAKQRHRSLLYPSLGSHFPTGNEGLSSETKSEETFIIYLFTFKLFI